MKEEDLIDFECDLDADAHELLMDESERTGKDIGRIIADLVMKHLPPASGEK